MARYTYAGPADVLVVGDKTYTRPLNGTVAVDIAKEQVEALAGHLFFDGDEQVAAPVPFAEQVGDRAPVAPTAEAVVTAAPAKSSK